MVFRQDVLLVPWLPLESRWRMWDGLWGMMCSSNLQMLIPSRSSRWFYLALSVGKPMTFMIERGVIGRRRGSGWKVKMVGCEQRLRWRGRRVTKFKSG